MEWRLNLSKERKSHTFEVKLLVHLTTKAIWDDGRDAGGGKIYEPGVKDLEESVNVIELSTRPWWD